MTVSRPPTELFVGSLGTGVARYAGQYLTRYGFSGEGLRPTTTPDAAIHLT